MTRRLTFALIALGFYLTLRGYHSRDGDQAYRLPLLLAKQVPNVYRTDPFVRAFDVFNPHHGYLAILDATSRTIGLSAALALLFALTFTLTFLGIERLTRAVWPSSGTKVGLWAVAMVLVAKAGNLGTNHLFEAMLLDRLIALALGWVAIASIVSDPARGGRWAAVCVGVAAMIHPSLGIQLGVLLAAGQIAYAILGLGVSRLGATVNAIMMVLALLPGWAMVAGQSERLMDGLPGGDYLALTASIQSPQHMLPHLWRMPQWLAGGAYLMLALLAIVSGSRTPGRDRILVMLVVTCFFLFGGWVAVEIVHSARITIFQPFRMATLARGLCLVLAADRVQKLWSRGDSSGAVRALILVSGLSGDWLMVVATAIELAASFGERFGFRSEVGIGAIAWVWGAIFLSRHDTEMGHWTLIGATLCGLVVSRGLARYHATRSERADPIEEVPRTARRRLALAMLAAWLIPVSAAIVPNVSHGKVAARLAEHCRFGEWAGDEVERLAEWCRANTPDDARFVGPPGPKTFRLWSRREVAFNRAASPYHAAGLADWAERFRDHVGFQGSIADFARIYLKDRQALEKGFDAMDASRLADLARREGAGYVLASSQLKQGLDLQPIRVDGRYAVYSVRSHDPASTALGAGGTISK